MVNDNNNNNDEANVDNFSFSNLLPVDASTRHARKIYLGNLPPSVKEEIVVAQFFNVTLNSLLPNKPPGDVVIGTFLNAAKRFAFIELRSIEETTFLLSLDGIVLLEHQLKLRRPQDYDPTLARQQLEIEMQFKRGVSALRGCKTLGVLSNSSDNTFVTSSLFSGFQKNSSKSITDLSEHLNKIIITNLALTVTNDKIINLISPYDRVRNITINLASDKKSKFAILELRNAENIKKICLKLDGTVLDSESIVIKPFVGSSSSDFNHLLELPDQDKTLALKDLIDCKEVLPNIKSQLNHHYFNCKIPNSSEALYNPANCGLRFVICNVSCNSTAILQTIEASLTAFASQFGILRHIYFKNHKCYYLEYSNNFSASLCVCYSNTSFSNFNSCDSKTVSPTHLNSNDDVDEQSENINKAFDHINRFCTFELVSPPIQIIKLAAKRFCKRISTFATYTNAARAELTEYEYKLKRARESPFLNT